MCATKTGLYFSCTRTQLKKTRRQNGESRDGDGGSGGGTGPQELYTQMTKTNPKNMTRMMKTWTMNQTKAKTMVERGLL
jgi:hypothetical protein